MSRLCDKIQKALDEINDNMGEDFQFHVWVLAGNGEMCTVYNNTTRITIKLELSENNNVLATASRNQLGFLGSITAMTVVLPNKTLYRQLEQLETIGYFLPEDNINDHFHKVVAEYVMGKRAKRRLERAKKRLDEMDA